MNESVSLRVNTRPRPTLLHGRLVAVDVSLDDAAWSQGCGEGACVLLDGDPRYVVALDALDAHGAELAAQLAGRVVLATVHGRAPLRRRVARVYVAAAEAVEPEPVNLTTHVDGARPLWLLSDGRFSLRRDVAPDVTELADALGEAARWVSTRRAETFERLFVDDVFHPERPTSRARLTAAQAEGMLRQLDEALAHAAVGAELARESPLDAAQLRASALTVLVHLAATGPRLPDLADAASRATRRVFGLVDAEQGDPTAFASLRAHAALSLARRGAALGAADLARVRRMLRAMLRASPPYGQLRGPWRFALCADAELHDAGCRALEAAGFTAVAAPASDGYQVYEAPFRTPDRRPVQVWARVAQGPDAPHELGAEGFVGVFAHRAATLGLFDLRAATAAAPPRGYKLFVTTQSAGLASRVALSRQLPDVDVYASWDATLTRAARGAVTQCEGVDCFVALLKCMSRQGTHDDISRAIRRAQWDHRHSPLPDFVQLLGPSHPRVAARFHDVDREGRAEVYDGVLELAPRRVADEVRAWSTPRVGAVTDEAARALAWAAASMGRVVLHSDLWARGDGDPDAELRFEPAGFYDAASPPGDVDGLQRHEVAARLPALCRVTRDGEALRVEVMLHAQLAHAGRAYVRLLVAAEAMNRLFDLGAVGREAPLNTPEGRRVSLLLTLSGLLEFPADQNRLDALWSAALTALNLPPLSRSLVRSCVTEVDHAAAMHHGSARGARQLLAALADADPVAWDALQRRDPKVGRATMLPA